MSGVTVGAVAAGAVWLIGGVANADPPPGTLGSLTITPAPVADTAPASARTSGPCPTTSDAQGNKPESANLLITGPVGATNPTFPPSNPFLFATGPAVFSTDGPFDLPFRETLKDTAKDRNTTLQAGEYDLTAQCVNGLFQTVFGTFAGAMYFTSPTAYTTTNPNKGGVPERPRSGLTEDPAA